MRGWTWAAASCRGTSHVQSGTKCQDAYCVLQSASDCSRLIAALCDGAGSALMGGQGAVLTARCMSQQARAHFLISSEFPDDAQLLKWIDRARATIADVALRRNLTPRDFASTLILILSNGSDTTVAHVGDGSAAVRDAATQKWHALSWPAHGEYASSTNFITDAPAAAVRIERHRRDVSSVVAFSDGLERLALNFAEQIPHAPFFNGVIAPVDNSVLSGRDALLSEQLAQYLDSKAVNDRTDDDKTLLLAVLK